MATLFLVFGFLVVTNERLNELLIVPVLDWLVSTVSSTFDLSKLLRYTTFLSGILLTWFFTAPLISFVVTQLELPAVEIEPMVVLFFGVLIGGGSQLFHDVWGLIVSSKEVLKARIEPA